MKRATALGLTAFAFLALTLPLASHAAEIPKDPVWQVTETAEVAKSGKNTMFALHGSAGSGSSSSFATASNDAGEAFVYNLLNDELVLVKSLELDVAFHDDVWAKVSPLLPGGAEVLDTPLEWHNATVLDDRLLVVCRVEVYDSEFDRLGDIVWAALINLETETLETSFAFSVDGQSDRIHSTVAHALDNEVVVFIASDCGRFGATCNAWTAWVSLDAGDDDNSGFHAGGAVEYLTGSVWDTANMEGVARYDVASDPTGSLSDWGNPTAVVWVVGTAYNSSSGNSYPFVAAFQLEDSGPTAVFVKEFPDLLEGDRETGGALFVGVGEAEDALVVIASSESWSEEDCPPGARFGPCGLGFEVYVLAKTLTAGDLLVDHALYHQGGAALDVIGHPVVQGSLDKKTLTVLQSMTQGSTRAAAQITFITDNSNKILARNAAECTTAEADNLDEAPGTTCSLFNNVPFVETSAFSASEWEQSPGEGFLLSSVCFSSEDSCRILAAPKGDSIVASLSYTPRVNRGTLLRVALIVVVAAVVIGVGVLAFMASQAGPSSASATASASASSDGARPLAGAAGGAGGSSGSRRAPPGARAGSSGSKRKGSSRGSRRSKGSNRSNRSTGSNRA